MQTAALRRESKAACLHLAGCPLACASPGHVPRVYVCVRMRMLWICLGWDKPFCAAMAGLPSAGPTKPPPPPRSGWRGETAECPASAVISLFRGLMAPTPRSDLWAASPGVLQCTVRTKSQIKTPKLYLLKIFSKMGFLYGDLGARQVME